MRWQWMAAMVLLLAGCRRVQRGVPAAAPARVASDPLAEWFGPRPHLVGKLASLHFGMTMTEARQVWPELHGLLDGSAPAEDVAGIETYFVSEDAEAHRRVDQLAVVVTRDAAHTRALFEGLWGEGTPLEQWGWGWLEPAAGLRVTLVSFGRDASMVSFQQIRPIADLLGLGRDFTFARRPILGLTRQEVVAAVPGFELAHDGFSARAKFPRTEWAKGPTVLVVNFDRVSGKAYRFELLIDEQLRHQAEAEIGAVMARKWGPPDGPVYSKSPLIQRETGDLEPAHYFYLVVGELDDRG